MYKIEKNVPIPEKANVVGRKSLYNFGGMEVGESFFVKGKKYAHIYSVAHSFSKRNKDSAWKFFVNEEESGTRIWRTK